MSNDAKLGLLLGLGLVLTMGLIFFHKEPAGASPPDCNPPAAVNPIPPEPSIQPTVPTMQPVVPEAL